MLINERFNEPADGDFSDVQKITVSFAVSLLLTAMKVSQRAINVIARLNHVIKKEKKVSMLNWAING